MSGISRREFLAGSAAVAGAIALGLKGSAQTVPEGQGLKIAKVECFPVDYPLAGRFKFFEDVHGNPVGRQTVVVKITADDGTVGWGQSVPTPKWSYETRETVVTTIQSYLAPIITGLDAFDIDNVHRAMDSIIAPSFSTGQPICKAGIDLALFDLTGKALGKTAAERWGRADKDRITMSWTLNPRTLDDVPEMIEQGQEKGYRNFNIKVAPDPDFDVALASRVKDLVPDGFLWPDANGGYTEAQAAAVLPRLKQTGVTLLEQPLPSNRLTGYRRLKEMKVLPIIMDEGVVSSHDLEEFIALGCLDGVAMKPARCGGLTEARRQVEMLEAHNLMFLGSGLTDPDISLAATLLLYGCYGLKYPAALNGPQFLSSRTILKNPFDVKDGELVLPEGPGLGVEIDEEALARYSSGYRA